MVRTLTTVDGAEVEVDDDQLEPIRGEAVDEYLEEHPDKSDELEQYKAEAEDAKAKLAEAEERLEGNTSEQNFAELRKAKEAAEKKAKETEEKYGKEISGIRELVVGKTKGETFRALAGDDEELTKKLEYHYSTTLANVPANTDEEIRERAKMAFKLASPDVRPSSLGYDHISSGGGASRPSVSKEGDLSFAKQALGEDKIKTLKADVQAMRERRTQ